MIGLSVRLKAIASLCVGKTVADIGCDHGRLGVWMLQNGLCKRVVAVDKSEECLLKAKRLASFVGLEDNMDFRLGDGVSALSPKEADTIVISGMGAVSIKNILMDKHDMLCGSRLVLQPQTSKEEFSGWLSASGFLVRDVKIVMDRKRQYSIFLIY